MLLNYHNSHKHYIPFFFLLYQYIWRLLCSYAWEHVFDVIFSVAGSRGPPINSLLIVLDYPLKIIVQKALQLWPYPFRVSVVFRTIFLWEGVTLNFCIFFVHRCIRNKMIWKSRFFRFGLPKDIFSKGQKRRQGAPPP